MKNGGRRKKKQVWEGEDDDYSNKKKVGRRRNEKINLNLILMFIFFNCSECLYFINSNGNAFFF